MTPHAALFSHGRNRNIVCAHGPHCPHPARMPALEGCLCNREDAFTAVTRSRSLQKGSAVNTCLRRHGCLGVVILSKQPSDGEPTAPKVLDVEIQVQGAMLSAPMGDFEFYAPKL
eukprot:1460771-Pyramimonas_sp.AAC.1